MLSRWTKAATSLVDSQLRTAGWQIPLDEKGNYVINLNGLRGSLPSLPENSLQRVAEHCDELFTPVCKTLAEDINTITHLLLELETSCDLEERKSTRESELDTASPSLDQDNDLVQANMVRGPQDLVHRERLFSKGRRLSYPPPTPIIIPSTHPRAPSIMISPCGSQNQEKTCRVPYQNSAFGKMLTVPSHPSYNTIHPPMLIPPSSSSLPLLEDWRWNDGHWEAVLPCLQQQTKRGLFSKAQSARRRSHRPCTPEH